MRLMKGWIWIGLLALLVTATACGSTAEEAGSGQTGTIPDSVSCEVFYRPAPGASFADSTLTLSTAGDRQSLAFEDMAFAATLVSDVGEGQSLSIVVSDSKTGAELTRGLYQFDPQAGLQDQFIGGHGFTGLAYVFHPASDSEVQYFCGVAE